MEPSNMTAVEWLVNEINKINVSTEARLFIDKLKERAKEIEKEQHQETFKQSRQAKIFEKDMPPVWESWKEYYKETYERK